MSWSVAYYRPPLIVVYTSLTHEVEALPTDGVLWVYSTISRRVSGHDHYWINDDHSIGCADHHDYDHEDWHNHYVPLDLPDTHVLNGIMAPDEIVQAVGLT